MIVTPRVYIAKMRTRYPEFHGSGYYNFIMAVDWDELVEKVDDISYDFMWENTVSTRYQSIESVVDKYPTKESLNDKFFKRAE